MTLKVTTPFLDNWKRPKMALFIDSLLILRVDPIFSLRSVITYK